MTRDTANNRTREGDSTPPKIQTGEVYGQNDPFSLTGTRSGWCPRGRIGKGKGHYYSQIVRITIMMSLTDLVVSNTINIL